MSNNTELSAEKEPGYQESPSLTKLSRLSVCDNKQLFWAQTNISLGSAAPWNVTSFKL